MLDVSSFKNQDLVLRVANAVDPTKFNVDEYEEFLEALCGGREHQRIAIRNVCNYLLGGLYENQSDLALENWRTNAVLKEKYPEFSSFAASLPFPDRLACDVDHATGTGKSYVMYGIARILLNENAIDQVLVLCPSLTIEAGLTEKFRELSGDSLLTELLPDRPGTRVPTIINATQSVTAGTICIENIHAAYKTSKSSLKETLRGKGPRTLVLNDEVHHVYSPTGRDAGIRRWKEFLVDPEFGFTRIVGFSGTCYRGNEYFPDVVARFSLLEAMESGLVKSIDYRAEGASGDQDEKLQLIYDNHRQNKNRYRLVRPLTILVTKDIARANALADELVAFLTTKESLPGEEAQKKVLVVTSADEHQGNVSRLRSGEPDDPNSPIEWIVSVSMLTEGWDVKNVFQIVPHEERAFNSKLLIAQVLGRGLRVPAPYRGEKPVVVIFNHDRWSTGIQHLVNEVLESERRVASYPVDKQPDYNFILHSIAYERAEKVVTTPQEREYVFKDYVELAGQSAQVEREEAYENVLTRKRRSKKTTVSFEMIPIDDAVAQIHSKFRAFDMETGKTYSKTYTPEKIHALIRKSLDRIGYQGNELSRENRNRILSAFGNMSRASNKSVRYEITPGMTTTMSTRSRPQDTVGLTMLRRGACIFFDDKALEEQPVAPILKELEESESFSARSLLHVANPHHFKTPLCTVITQSEPERRFVRGLIATEIAAKLTAWIKSTDSGFYEIEYSFSRVGLYKAASFNPDFFIRIGNDVLIVEVKDDSEVKEPSLENVGKMKAARKHFELLNTLQRDIHYKFCFLTPSDFDVFFTLLRDGKHRSYQSSLDVALLEYGET